MPRRENWTRDQQLLALRLYMRTPFGRLDSRNPAEISRSSQSFRAFLLPINNRRLMPNMT